MAIRFGCPCGKQFSALESYGGKRAKCPECSRVLVVPKSASAPPRAGGDGEDVYALQTEQEGAGPCPLCGAVLPSGAVVCVQCEYDVQTGQRVPRHSPGPVAAPGAAVEEGGSGVRDVEAPGDWRETLVGAFVYAFAAVFRGQGWLCWLWAVGFIWTILAVLWLLLHVPVIGFLLVVFFSLPLNVLIVGAVAVAAAGLLWRNMEIAGSRGADDCARDYRMDPVSDMIGPFLRIFAVTFMLGFLPWLFFMAAQRAGVFRAVPFLDSDFIYRLLMHVITFCVPMCVMLLGVTDVFGALNPVNVFKAIFRAPLQYLAFWAYLVIVDYLLLSVLLTLLVLVAFGWALPEAVPTGLSPHGGPVRVGVAAHAGPGGSAWGPLAHVDPFAFVFSVTRLRFFLMALLAPVVTYWAAVVGWSMGVFLYRNRKQFEDLA